MTPTEIGLVQDSFAKVVPIRDQAAELFYARLFEIDPSAAPLFASSDMKMQGTKLMAALSMIVADLHHPDVVAPRAQELARRHVAYGVSKQHYASVGAALLWTLEQGLGAAYTPEVADAWSKAYALLSGVMMSEHPS